MYTQYESDICCATILIAMLLLVTMLSWIGACDDPSGMADLSNDVRLNGSVVSNTTMSSTHHKDCTLFMILSLTAWGLVSCFIVCMCTYSNSRPPKTLQLVSTRTYDTKPLTPPPSPPRIRVTSM